MRKVRFSDCVMAVESSCEHFDKRTNLCKVYERRFEMNPECLTVKQAIEQRVLPDDCPYVKNVKPYKSIVSWL